MRYLLIFWALPMGLFWGWYHISYNDMHFGYVFLSRAMHDLVFEIYGKFLGLEPAAIPALAARACMIDTVILFAILAFRRRRVIRGWISQRRQRYLRGEPARSA